MSANDKASVVVMISGSGTNLGALIAAMEDGRLPINIPLVVSNRKAAYGLTRAAQEGIPALYAPLKPYKNMENGRERYDADLADKIAALNPDLVVLAGWMHILSPAFLDRVGARVINLHPALPGAFAGTHAIKRAYEAYQRGEITESGCMVHDVIPEIDAGEALAQTAVPIFPDDSLADFEARMHAAEHELIVETVGKTAVGIVTKQTNL